jgi:hypothetical protein
MLTYSKRPSGSNGPLRRVLEQAAEEYGFSLDDLTVLSTQKDPYRLDTPAGHRDGAWLAKQLSRFYSPTKQAHWRGLHYAIVMAKTRILKPNGETYQNTDADWIWLSEKAGKAARWLGYIPFERIKDQRNAPPIIHRKSKTYPHAWLSIGLSVDIPDADDLEPTPYAVGFDVRQAFHFVIFGEKSSLEDVLLPVAEAYEADLYLPTGEISEALVYQIAIALLPEQVRSIRPKLPETPLKKEEKRKDRWTEAFGIKQTEIDALTTPERSHILREMFERAFESYIDGTLSARVQEAKREWHAAAQEVVEEQINAEALDEIRTEAAERLEELRTEIDTVNEKLQLAASDHFSLPPIRVPEAEVDLDPTRQEGL